MAYSSKSFGQSLTNALYRIRADSGKKLRTIEDELEFALGRGGGSFIPYLRKGNVPAEPADLEQLTRELVERGGLPERHACIQFLRHANYPAADRFVGELFPNGSGELESPNARLQHSGAQHLDPQHLGQQHLGPQNLGPQQLGQSEAEQIRKSRRGKSRQVEKIDLFGAELRPMPGSPTTAPHAFLGRTELIHRLFYHYLRPFAMQHVTITGPRGSGKTSLLHYLQQLPTLPMTSIPPTQQLALPPPAADYRWIHIDFYDPRMKHLDGVLRHWLTALEISAPAHCDLENFVELLEGYHWQTPVVVLMDEIEAGFASAELCVEFWEALRWLVSNHQVQQNLAFVFFTDKPLLALAKERNKISPLWNIFNNEQLGPLTEDEARALVTAFCGTIVPDDIQWIVQQSGRWPKLLHVLCQARLMAPDEAPAQQSWKEEGLRRIAPFSYLLGA